ncbi:RHS repeat-associated core domain-containing protein [Pseudomonas fluorescens]|uniref:RHS repeat-associated core domain-containing protein n=1 Tax=Pseudomonas fluorescens TaxID=294 RepID=A0A5E7CJF9_PSEFL|nr:RHS repeat-associated core domain-containing protein [Pseudomonas fluorescens]VVO04481.1 hypothetical protein PS723_02910 [Pseudomonas fluorescens]
MPTSSHEIPLCHYRYDPLDHLVDCTPFEQAAIQRYYCKTRLATEIQGAVQTRIFQHEDQLLALQQSESGQLDTTLLATDQQRSVLNTLDATQPNPFAYSPYGHRPRGKGLLSLLGFNGERPDPVTGHYHLGNGYRQFNPVLMRFNSPDSWSPFGEGGLNAYAYCAGDPVNRTDSTGHGSLRNFIASLPKKSEAGLSYYSAKKALTETQQSLGKSSYIKARANIENISAEQFLLEKSITRTIREIDKEMYSFFTRKPISERQVLFDQNFTLKLIKEHSQTLIALADAGNKFTGIRPGTVNKGKISEQKINDFKNQDVQRITNERRAHLSRPVPQSPSSTNDDVRRP